MRQYPPLQLVSCLAPLFYNKAMLKHIVDFGTLLIGAEGARLLREDGAGETPQAQSAEEAPRTARGKRSAWSGNQQPVKQSYNKDFKIEIGDDENELFR